ncbi:hypothetical protein [Polaribacter sp. R77954]|uniref:hypothetical protein n=1 Tax=Polaribacter sp. R77954 TaxID=3093870 RepID=UPI0037CC1A21
MKSTYTNTIERGILTSAYKREIRANISESKTTTLSKMKSMVEAHQENMQSATGTILKVSFFMIAIIFMVA